MDTYYFDEIIEQANDNKLVFPWPVWVRVYSLHWILLHHFSVLVQGSSIFSALAMELLQSCIKPSFSSLSWLSANVFLIIVTLRLKRKWQQLHRQCFYVQHNNHCTCNVTNHVKGIICPCHNGAELLQCFNWPLLPVQGLSGWFSTQLMKGVGWNVIRNELICPWGRPLVTNHCFPNNLPGAHFTNSFMLVV